MRSVTLLVLCAATTTYAAPALAPQYAALFEQGRTWTYRLDNTPFDLVEHANSSRLVPSKHKDHSDFTCRVAKVVIFDHSTASLVTCDKDIDSDYSFRVDGIWIATKAGLSRGANIDLPVTETELSIGSDVVIPAQPKVSRTKTKGMMEGFVVSSVTNPAKGEWCTSTDTTKSGADGAVTTLCFATGVGISRASLDYHGGDPRLLDYAVARP